MPGAFFVPLLRGLTFLLTGGRLCPVEIPQKPAVERQERRPGGIVPRVISSKKQVRVGKQKNKKPFAGWTGEGPCVFEMPGVIPG